MKVNKRLVDLIAKLLSETTSLAIVSAFLKERRLAHSAPSWDSMINNRLRPALKSRDISFEDLVELLGSVEEHGRQHVFLYRCSKD